MSARDELLHAADRMHRVGYLFPGEDTSAVQQVLAPLLGVATAPEAVVALRRAAERQRQGGILAWVG